MQLGVMRCFSFWGALMMLGCSNSFNKEVEQWNKAFASASARCGGGQQDACRSACRMTRDMALCKKAQGIIDPENGAQMTWLRNCPASMERQGKEVCAKAGDLGPRLPPAYRIWTGDTSPPVEVANPEAVKRDSVDDRTNSETVDTAPTEKGTPGIGGPMARNVTIRPGSPLVNGAISKAQVDRIVKRHLNEVRVCYERHRGKDVTSAERLSVKFVVSGTGAVQMAVTASSTLKAPAVESCVSTAVRRWLFPQPQGGGIVIVTYPFEFIPAGQ